MKNIYMTEETAKRLMEALGIQAEAPKKEENAMLDSLAELLSLFLDRPALSPKLCDAPIFIIPIMHIYPARNAPHCEAEDPDEDDEFDEEDCEDEEEDACIDFEADKTGRCVHSCPECGKCMLED